MSFILALGCLCGMTQGYVSDECALSWFTSLGSDFCRVELRPLVIRHTCPLSIKKVHKVQIRQLAIMQERLRHPTYYYSVSEVQSELYLVYVFV